MDLFKYFKPVSKPVLPKEVSLLTEKELRDVNAKVKATIVEEEAKSQKGTKYNYYTPEQRASIGRYAAVHGPIRAVEYFSKTMKTVLPEMMVRRFKKEYLKEVSKKVSTSEVTSSGMPTVKALPTKDQGRPLLLGQEIDKIVQEYVNNLRIAGVPVTTAIVMGAAKGIVAAKNCSLLKENGGHLEITNTWAKSLLKRMNYVKRKCSNAGKISQSCFTELQDVFLADIKAEVLINDIPSDLIINWDQTSIQLVPTGDWTLNRAGERIIPIHNPDDKRQITAVIAATMTGEYLPIQLIYKGKTDRCHLKIAFPSDWDIFHSENHWSNENAMKRYFDRVFLPYIEKKREMLKLEKCHPALAIIDSFHGQTTPDFLSLLESHGIVPIIVPANCTDKLHLLTFLLTSPSRIN